MFAPWASLRQVWVAEVDGVIVGFATVEHVPWHQRLVLWLFLHHYCSYMPGESALYLAKSLRDLA